MMKLWSNSFENNQLIPSTYAFCKMHATDHLAMSDNLNPHFAWQNLPTGTRSLVLICHDPDSPSVGDNVNQENKTVSKQTPRAVFYHWGLVNISAERKSIEVGEFSNGITAKGKPGPQSIDQTLQAINDYTTWFASDKEMDGIYFGYDGPCPPWNDEIAHHYIFTLYALDVEKLELSDHFNCSDILSSIKNHILDKASITGVYTLNPEVKL